jgi:hypothetical protein
MARRKRVVRKAPVRRRRTTVAKRPTVRRRRSSSKGMLSQMFSTTMATSGAKTLISGAVGGIGATLLGKVIPASTTPEMKAVYGLGAGFLTATLLKMPIVAAGMSAVAVSDLLKGKGLLSEDYGYANDLDSLPMALNENEMQYLAENGMYLAEDYNYNVGYYPAGFGGM